MRSPILLIGCIALTGCSMTGSLFGGPDSSSPARGPEPGATATSSLETRALGLYLETMEALIEGDSVTQAEVFENASEAAVLSPTTTNRLRLALALATPGHPGADPVAAQRQLADLLAAGDSLLPEERVLATIHLQEVEERLILDSAAQQQRQRSAAEISRLNADSTERLQAAEDENRRLREELAEAQEKLEAITSIERSIRERDGTAGVP